MTALAGQPYRVAGTAARFQPKRRAAVGLLRQLQREPVTLTLDIRRWQPHTAQPYLWHICPEPLGTQAPLLLVIVEQVAAPLQLLDPQRVRCSLCTKAAKP
ncbi:hypothetical protein D3C81_1879680 [compost metagenome]